MALTTLQAGFQETTYDHRVVDIRRVVRVMKGGRRFRFRATVIVGNKRGAVGLGLAKGKDVQQAVAKAQEAAKKHLVRVLLFRGTVPHAIQRRFRGAVVLIKPAPEGSGIIAGGPIRSVALLAGIHDLSSKMMGSHNPVNVIKATLLALSSMKSAPTRSKESSSHVHAS
jgi:small subunit ribosomal protein S5